MKESAACIARPVPGAQTDKMTNPTFDPMVALHRYFIWANRMRTHFQKVLGQLKPGEPLTWGSEHAIEAYMYMSYWYGGLHVVVEGWKELGSSDGEIDKLLETSTGRKVELPAKEGGATPHIVDEKVVDVLRRYRNGAFHFQRDYFDDRFVKFMQLEHAAEWARALNQAFGRYFLDWFKRRKPPAA